MSERQVSASGRTIHVDNDGILKMCILGSVFSPVTGYPAFPRYAYFTNDNGKSITLDIIRKHKLLVNVSINQGWFAFELYQNEAIDDDGKRTITIINKGSKGNYCKTRAGNNKCTTFGDNTFAKRIYDVDMAAYEKETGKPLVAILQSATPNGDPGSYDDEDYMDFIIYEMLPRQSMDFHINALKIPTMKAFATKLLQKIENTPNVDLEQLLKDSRQFKTVQIDSFKGEFTMTNLNKVKMSTKIVAPQPSPFTPQPSPFTPTPPQSYPFTPTPPQVSPMTPQLSPPTPLQTPSLTIHHDQDGIMKLCILGLSMAPMYGFYRESYFTNDNGIAIGEDVSGDLLNSYYMFVNVSIHNGKFAFEIYLKSNQNERRVWIINNGSKREYCKIAIDDSQCALFKDGTIARLLYDLENKQYTMAHAGAKLVAVLSDNSGILNVDNGYRTDDEYIKLIISILKMPKTGAVADDERLLKFGRQLLYKINNTQDVDLQQLMDDARLYTAIGAEDEITNFDTMMNSGELFRIPTKTPTSKYGAIQQPITFPTPQQTPAVPRVSPPQQPQMPFPTPPTPLVQQPPQQPLVMPIQPQMHAAPQKKPKKTRAQKRSVNATATQSLQVFCNADVSEISPACYGGDSGIICSKDDTSHSCDYRTVKVPANFHKLDTYKKTHDYGYYMTCMQYEKLSFHLGRAKVRFAAAALAQTTYSRLALTRHFMPFVGYHSVFGIDNNGDVNPDQQIPQYNASLNGNLKLVNATRVEFSDDLNLLDISSWQWTQDISYPIFKGLINVIMSVYTGSYTDVVVNQAENAPVYRDHISNPYGSLVNQNLECFRLPTRPNIMESCAIMLSNRFAKTITADNTPISNIAGKYYQSPNEVLTFNAGLTYYVNSPFFMKDPNDQNKVIPNPKYIPAKMNSSYQQQYSRGVGFLGVAIDNLKMAAIIYHLRMWFMLQTLQNISNEDTVLAMRTSHMFFLTDFEHKMLCLVYASMTMYQKQFFDYKRATSLDYAKPQQLSEQKFTTFMTEMLLQYHMFTKRTSKKNKTNMMVFNSNSVDANMELYKSRMGDIMRVHGLAILHAPYNIQGVRAPDAMMQIEQLAINHHNSNAIRHFETRVRTPIPQGETLADETAIKGFTDSSVQPLMERFKLAFSVTMNAIFGAREITEADVHAMLAMRNTQNQLAEMMSGITSLKINQKLTLETLQHITDTIIPTLTDIVNKCNDAAIVYNDNAQTYSTLGNAFVDLLSFEGDYI